MTIDPTTAAQFYASAKPATKPDSGILEAGESFTQIAQSFTQTLQNGEQTAKAALTGNADTPSLVMALANSEMAVKTAVTVRDKVVEAYQEILRMPV